MLNADKFKWKAGELTKGVNHGIRLSDEERPNKRG